jgi:hypothetical protein
MLWLRHAALLSAGVSRRARAKRAPALRDSGLTGAPTYRGPPTSAARWYARLKKLLLTKRTPRRHAVLRRSALTRLFGTRSATALRRSRPPVRHAPLRCGVAERALTRLARLCRHGDGTAGVRRLQDTADVHPRRL